MRRRAFTLIELLLVLAVIVVLISLIVPSLTIARENARRLACTANMRSMALALRMYFNDNSNHQPVHANGYAPLQADGSFGAQTTEYLYPVVLAPYLGLSGIANRPKSGGTDGQRYAYVAGVVNGPYRKSALFCPSEPWRPTASDVSQVAGGALPSSNWIQYTTYGAVEVSWHSPTGSSQYDPGNDQIPNITYLRESMTTYLATGRNYKYGPEDVAIFGHMFGNKSMYLETYSCNANGTQDWHSYSYNTPNSHLNRLPFAFLDGHAEILGLADLVGDPVNYSAYMHTNASPAWTFGRTALWFSANWAGNP